jgi:hypothetical protein
MKKVIPAIIVLVAIAAGAFVFFKKAVVHHIKAVELVPADTIFFANLPDLGRTASRWPKTALAQIGQEPEVKAFLARPQSTPEAKVWDDKVEQLQRVQPGEAFLAVTSIEGNEPRFIAGFSFSGRKSDADALLAEGRAQLKAAWPAGKSDVTMQGRTEIDTFTYQDTTVGEAFVEDWYLVSDDMELLRHTIDAAPNGLGEKGLAASDVYRKSTARLPADGEAVLFAQVGSITDRLIALLKASGQTLSEQDVAGWKKIQAIAWGTRFEDALLRDTLFILSPGNAVEPPLAQNSLALSNGDTFLTYSTALPKTIELPDLSYLGIMVPGLGAFQKGLSDKGLKPNDFGQAFGPTFGAVLGWPQGAAQPSTLLAMDVRDSKTAKNFVEAFAGNPPWTHEDKEGVTFYQSPAGSELIPIAPCLALTDRFLVIGFSEPEVAAGVDQVKTGKAVIASNPAFVQASQAVSAPTSAFGYLDLKTLFERSYGTLRPFLAMSLAFVPDSGKYVDAGKLPGTDAISKHLSPAVYSQAVTADGTLIESVGPLTFNDVLGVTLGAAVVEALPLLEKTFSNGLNLDPNALQLPGALTPPAPGGTPSTPAPPADTQPPADKPAATPAPEPKTP